MHIYSPEDHLHVANGSLHDTLAGTAVLYGLGQSIARPLSANQNISRITNYSQYKLRKGEHA